MDEYPDSASRLAISLIYPTLEHYETFAQNFVKLMAQAVDVAMMWGLLFLVFKASALHIMLLEISSERQN